MLFFLLFCTLCAKKRKQKAFETFALTKQEHSILFKASNAKELLLKLKKYDFNQENLNEFIKKMKSILGSNWYDQQAQIIIDYKEYKNKKHIVNFKFKGCNKEFFVKGIGLMHSDEYIQYESKLYSSVRYVFNENFENFIKKKDMPEIFKKKIISFYKKSKLNINKGLFICIYEPETFKIIGIEFMNKGKKRYVILFKDRIYLDTGFPIEGKKIEFALPVNGRISSKFGRRFHPVLKTYKFHGGLDIAPKKKGELPPIYCMKDGSVTFAGRKPVYGNCVKIQHNDGIETFYAHMSRFNPKFKSKKINIKIPIKKGEIIGYIGSTGLSTGPHLHYEVHVNKKRVNPYNFSYSIRKSLKGKELLELKQYAQEVFSY